MRIEYVMDQSSLRAGGSEIDLEWGDTKSGESGDEKLKVSGASSMGQLDRASQLLNTSEEGGRSFSSQHKRSGFDVNVIKGKKLPDELKEQMVEKKMSCKCPIRPEPTRSSKPPRPPTGPSMDAADWMLVKEISELAILKRKRIERMKTLHKVKKEKQSSISSSSFAMIVTLIFFIVIIWHGKTFFSI